MRPRTVLGTPNAPLFTPLAHRGRNVKNDGSVNSTDRAIIDALALANNEMGTPITESAYNADADINRDGQVNEEDGMFFAAIPASAPLGGAGGGSGLISDPHDPDGPDNVFGYCGYAFNAEHRVYTVRYRHRSSERAMIDSVTGRVYFF